MESNGWTGDIHTRHQAGSVCDRTGNSGLDPILSRKVIGTSNDNEPAWRIVSDIQSEWARCRPWIETALKTNDFYTIEYIEDQISTSIMTLWPGSHGCVLTEFQTFPNGRALNVFGGGGEENAVLQEFVEVFDPCMVNWAKMNKCKWIVIYGRPGWQRVGRGIGYRPVWNVIAKDVAE